MIKLIWAQGPRGELGLDNKLPWKGVKEDLVHFNNMINGKILIMGSKTYDSLPWSVVKDKSCIVITRNKNRKVRAPLTMLVSSAEEALALVGDFRDAMVVGGKQIYDMFMPHADMLIISVIYILGLKADTYAPEVPASFNFCTSVPLSQRVEVLYYVKDHSK